MLQSAPSPLVDGEALEWLCYRQLTAEASQYVDHPAIEPTRASDPMLIYFTSGTNGHPKMVLHAQSFALGLEVTARFAQTLTDRDLHWAVSEAGWAKAAWGKLFGQMIVGSAISQWETPGRFRPGVATEGSGALRVGDILRRADRRSHVDPA